MLFKELIIMGKLLDKVNIGQELVALNVKHSEQRFLQLIYNAKKFSYEGRKI